MRLQGVADGRVPEPASCRWVLPGTRADVKVAGLGIYIASFLTPKHIFVYSLLLFRIRTLSASWYTVIFDIRPVADYKNFY